MFSFLIISAIYIYIVMLHIGHNKHDRYQEIYYDKLGNEIGRNGEMY